MTAKERMPAAPKAPIMAESGLPDFVSGSGAGAIAPAGVTTEIVNCLASEIAKILHDPARREKLASQGTIGSTLEEHLKFYRAEVAL